MKLSEYPTISAGRKKLSYEDFKVREYSKLIMDYYILTNVKPKFPEELYLGAQSSILSDFPRFPVI